MRPVDGKDQTYFCGLKQERCRGPTFLAELDKSLWCSGNCAPSVSAGGEKAESQEICFVPSGKLRSIYLGVFGGTREGDAGGRKGDPRNDGGEVIGTHPRMHHYTRSDSGKGLGIAREEDRLRRRT